MALQIVQGPQQEPISLNEAKLHLKVEVADDDELINGLIVTAREYAEMFTRRSLVSQTWLLTLDRFPSPRDFEQGYNDYGIFGDSLGIHTPPPGYSYRPMASGYFRAGSIIVPKPPLQQVNSIKYRDTNAILQTLDPSQYFVDDQTEPARISPAPNAVWPLTQISTRAPVLNTVQVQFVSGYADNPERPMPKGIGLAMKFLMAHWYENRSAVRIGTRLTEIDVPLGAEVLLWANRIYSVP